MTKYSKIIFLFIIFFNISILPQVDSKAYLENAMVTDIKEEPEFIWVATYGYGIFRYSKEDEKWTNFSTKSNNLQNDLFYCIDVNKDYVWAGSGEGLFIYDKKKDKWYKKRFSLGGEWGNWIRSLYFDKSQNVLWIGRFVNLTKLDLKKYKYTDYNKTIAGDPKTNNFKVIKADGDGLIWFGTESGVHIYNMEKDPEDTTAWKFINNKNGFNEDGDAVSISDILFEENYVWFATDEFITDAQPQFNIGGIYRFDKKSHWDRLSSETGLPANGIYCLEKTGNKIWSGTYAFNKDDKKEYGNGISLVDRFSGRTLNIDLNKTGISTSKILCLHFDGKNMWVGTDKGLWKIKIYNSLAAWGGKENVEIKNKKKSLRKKTKGNGKQIPKRNESSW